MYTYIRTLACLTLTAFLSTGPSGAVELEQVVSLEHPDLDVSNVSIPVGTTANADGLVADLDAGRGA